MAEESAESWLKKGDEFFERRKYNDALDCYLNATDLDPDSAIAWHNMGLICQLLGQQKEADICFENERIAIQKSTIKRISKIKSEIKEDLIPETLEKPQTDNPEGLYQKGINLSQNNQLDEALLIFEQVILLDPTNYQAWNSKGTTLAKLQRYQEADKAFNHALIINPSYQPAINNLNRVQEILKVPEPAKQIQSNEILQPPVVSVQSNAIEKKKSFCSKCGAELQFENAEICPKCGVRIKEPPQAKGEKSPVIAALLSFIFPGLGQVYNGNFTGGLLFLIGIFIGVVFFIIPGVIVWVYQIYDAYSTAKKMNAGEIPFKETNTAHIILYIVLLLVAMVIFILIAAVIAAFVFGMSGAVTPITPARIQSQPQTPITSSLGSTGMSVEQIKASAIKVPEDLDYINLIRNIERYQGQIINFDGVIDMRDENNGQYLFHITDVYEDQDPRLVSGYRTYYVNYKGERYLLKDSIRVWGRVKGLYTLGFGKTQTPEIDALYIGKPGEV